MPFVEITIQYHPLLKMSDVLLIAEVLPRIVADALTCDNPDDGHLAPSDVEIEIKGMSPAAHSRHLLQITVDAEDFPERRANLDNRRGRIIDELRRRFPSVWPSWSGNRFKPKGSVRVRLALTSTGEF